MFNLNLNIFDPYTMFNETYNDNDNDKDHNDHNHNDNDNDNDNNDNIYEDYIPSTQRWTNYFG